MPELPEVETLRCELQAAVVGHKVCGMHFFRKDLREPMPIQALQELVQEGSYLQTIERRGKYLLWHIHKYQNYQGSLLCHLGMSGRMRYHSEVPSSFPVHTHWYLWGKKPKSCDLWCVSYEDPRRFGRLGVWKGALDQIQQHIYLKALGREPLEGRSSELGKYLYEHSRGRGRSLKSWLMDGGMVVGVGNIYASEALFRARLSPFRAAQTLSKEEAGMLGRQVRKTLNLALKQGGSTFKDFHSLHGDPGMFPLKALVYGRQGQPCSECGAIIIKMRQNQRSTYYCPHCQQV